MSPRSHAARMSGGWRSTIFTFGRVDAGELEGGEQAVVGGRAERRADLLADEARDVGDARVLARHERLGDADHVEDPRHLVGDVERVGETGGHGAAAGEADVDAAGDHRGVDVGARVELDPLDLSVGQLGLEPTLVLDDEVAVRDGW